MFGFFPSVRIEVSHVFKAIIANERASESYFVGLILHRRYTTISCMTRQKIDDGLSKQARWKLRQGAAWKKHRNAYMREYMRKRREFERLYKQTISKDANEDQSLAPLGGHKARKGKT